MEFKVSSRKTSVTDIFMKKAIYSETELNELSFNLMDSKDDLNERLKNLSHKYNFHFFDTRNIVCNVILKKCDVIGEDYAKYYYDKSHWTLNGAKFYMEKLIDNGFLELLDSLTEN
jgi:hypothetical protein